MSPESSPRDDGRRNCFGYSMTMMRPQTDRPRHFEAAREFQKRSKFTQLTKGSKKQLKVTLPNASLLESATECGHHCDTSHHVMLPSESPLKFGKPQSIRNCDNRGGRMGDFIDDGRRESSSVIKLNSEKATKTSSTTDTDRGTCMVVFKDCDRTSSRRQLRSTQSYITSKKTARFQDVKSKYLHDKNKPDENLQTNSNSGTVNRSLTIVASQFLDKHSDQDSGPNIDSIARDDLKVFNQCVEYVNHLGLQLGGKKNDADVEERHNKRHKGTCNQKIKIRGTATKSTSNKKLRMTNIFTIMSTADDAKHCQSKLNNKSSSVIERTSKTRLHNSRPTKTRRSSSTLPIDASDVDHSTQTLVTNMSLLDKGHLQQVVSAPKEDAATASTRSSSCLDCILEETDGGGGRQWETFGGDGGDSVSVVADTDCNHLVRGRSKKHRRKHRRRPTAASSVDTKKYNSIQIIQQECEAQGYDILKTLPRCDVMSDVRERCQILLANKTGNTSVSPVEITVYDKESFNCTVSQVPVGGSSHIDHATMTTLQHCNLMQLLHRFETPLRCYLVSEYCPWPTLSQLIHVSRVNSRSYQKGLGEQQCHVIFAQMCSGLQHLHTNGLLHGDLSCHSVLVSDSLHVKLTGYGPCCRRHMIPTTPTPAPPSAMPDVRAWEVSGRGLADHAHQRDVYTPPEIHQGRSVWGTHCDIWCLGLTLLNMMLGEIPNEVTHTMLTSDPRKDRGHWIPVLRYQAILLMDKMLQEQPSDRPTVDQILGNSWVRGDPGTLTSPMRHVTSPVNVHSLCYEWLQKMSLSMPTQKVSGEQLDQYYNRDIYQSPQPPLSSPVPPSQSCSSLKEKTPRMKRLETPNNDYFYESVHKDDLIFSDQELGQDATQTKSVSSADNCYKTSTVCGNGKDWFDSSSDSGSTAELANVIPNVSTRLIENDNVDKYETFVSGHCVSRSGQFGQAGTKSPLSKNDAYLYRMNDVNNQNIETLEENIDKVRKANLLSKTQLNEPCAHPNESVAFLNGSPNMNHNSSQIESIPIFGNTETVDLVAPCGGDMIVGVALSRREEWGMETLNTGTKGPKNVFRENENWKPNNARDPGVGVRVTSKPPPCPSSTVGRKLQNEEYRPT